MSLVNKQYLLFSASINPHLDDSKFSKLFHIYLHLLRAILQRSFLIQINF